MRLPIPRFEHFQTYIYIYIHTYLAEIIFKSDILNPDIPIANIGNLQTMLKQKCDWKLLMKFP
jgi:hypothetical protein